MRDNTKIYVNTTAYNAEKTIRRAIESVLNQTYKNIVYCIRDNGSRDNTYAICKEYAAEDNRIILFHNHKNNVFETDEERAQSKKLSAYIFSDLYENDDYWCSLDADDEYMCDFFEKGIHFSWEQNLDIVIGGTEIVNERINRVIDDRTHSHSWIIGERQSVSDMLPLYYWHARQVWGKLYRRKVLYGTQGYLDSLLKRELKENSSLGLHYGVDTVVTLYAFRNAERIGALSGCYHKYYIQPGSVSSIAHPNRIESDRILHDEARSFLIKKCGDISSDNNAFLYRVYLNAIRDTLNVLFKSDAAPHEKTQNVHSVMTCDKTKKLFSGGYKSSREFDEMIREPVVKWLFRETEYRTAAGAKTVSEILISMYPELSQFIKQEILAYIVSKMPEMVEYIINKEYSRILDRLKMWHKKHGKNSAPLIELEIAALREMSPLLENLTPGLLSAFSRVIYMIAHKDYMKALNEFVSISRNVEIPNDDAENYFSFAQNLSAAAEDIGAYVYFKKAWISYLIDIRRVDEAERELDEFEEILPGDGDFADLRNLLNVSRA